MIRMIPFLFVFVCCINNSNAQLLDSSGMQFVNYKNLLSCRAALSNEYFDIHDTATKMYYYAEMKSFDYVPVATTKRNPLNISIVIDNSGSMSGAKLTYVKQASVFLVEQLNADDFISIVEYSDTAVLRFPADNAKDKQKIISIINSIYTAGSTNMGAGMRMGYAEVKKNFKEGYTNRVLVLSDGQVNRGMRKQEELESFVRRFNDEDKITLSSFGVGLDFNENLMTAISEQGSGNYYFIENPESISEIFLQELKGLTSVIAQNALLKIKIPNGMFVEKVYGYPYKLEGNIISINFRSLSKLQTKAVLIRCRIEQPASMYYEFESIFSFADVTEQDKLFQQFSIKQSAINVFNPELIRATINHKVIEQGILFESIEMLDMATKEVDRRNFNGARRLLDYNSEFLKRNEFYVARSIELQNHQKLNLDYRVKLEKAETMTVEDMKYMQKANKESNYIMKTKKMK